MLLPLGDPVGWWSPKIEIQLAAVTEIAGQGHLLQRNTISLAALHLLDLAKSERGQNGFVLGQASDVSLGRRQERGSPDSSGRHQSDVETDLSGHLVDAETSAIVAGQTLPGAGIDHEVLDDRIPGARPARRARWWPQAGAATRTVPARSPPRTRGTPR